MDSSDIRIKQVEYLYDNLPSALLGIAVITVVIFFSFTDLVGSSALSYWTALSLGGIFLRFLLYFKYKRVTITEENINFYYRIFYVGLLYSASVWGSSVIFIFPDEREYQILLLLILGGISSGAAISTCSRIEMFFSYLIISLTPFVIVFWLQNAGISHTLAFFSFFYIIILILISRSISLHVNKNILLGFQNEKLVEEMEVKVEEANKSNEAKSRFLSTMSHEIRTPMNAIIGFIKILQQMEDEPKKIKYLNVIDSSSNVLLHVLNDILDLSKIESGSLTVEDVVFNPKEEFDIIFELFQEPCNEKGVILHNKINLDKDLYITSDKLRLKQILSNLLSNALKFTPTQNKIYLISDYDYKSEMLSLKVIDEGIGIEAKFLETITQEFSQEDDSVARKYGGTGLGLSIVSKLLGLLGSTLEIQSTKGKGSSFSFYIHAKLTQAESEVLHLKEDVDLSRKKVLVAEDNKTNQMLLGLLLEDLGLKVFFANDGQMAEEMCQEEIYDLVLMDINMPNKNGIEAMHAIKIDSKVPIIAVTANAVSGDKEKYIEEGFDAYLSKPIDADALAIVLQKYLG